MHLTFNCAKSSCFAIGKGNKLTISDMNLGLNRLQWCDSFKYLGVTFQAGRKLKVNIDVIKQKFVMASNSVLGNSHSIDELIQLQLLESFCLPVLQYAMCAVKLSSSQSSCWNSVYRRVFNFRKYDSVRACMWSWPVRFSTLTDLCILDFIKKGFYSSNNVVRCMAKLFSVSHEFHLLCTKVGVTPHRIDATPIYMYALRCSVHKNFALMMQY